MKGVNYPLSDKRTERGLVFVRLFSDVACINSYWPTQRKTQFHTLPTSSTSKGRQKSCS